ncbi:MAG: hypothetical protein IJU16_06520, partial [Clostridia bacterium]|nr:hypothetical protein [Clostridia bacterium]
MKHPVRAALALALVTIMVASVFSGCDWFVNGVEALWSVDYIDADSGFADQSAVKSVIKLENGVEKANYTADIGDNDVQYMFRSEDATRFVDLADGYAITIPDTTFEVDDTLGSLKTVLQGDNYRLSITYEDQSPYGNTLSGWNTYNDEWFKLYIADKMFLTKNGLVRSRAIVDSTDLIKGYSVQIYDIEFKDPEGIEYPYYHIAVVRRRATYNAFHMLHMKSKEPGTDFFDAIVRSFDPVDPQGQGRDMIDQYEVKIPEYWSEETKAYYNLLLQNMQSTRVEWGVFRYSLPSKGEGNYRSTELNLKNDMKWLQSESGLNTNLTILPTYQHLGWYNNDSHFALDLVKEFGGGNGFNGKPVLQLSYQFTRTNNTELSGTTPMFDILRGECDDQFREL